MNNKTFYLPGFVEKEIMIKTIVTLIENDRTSNQKIFREDFDLGSYGCFPACIWNGGRMLTGEVHGIERMKYIFDWYYKHNIKLQVIFSNGMLKETDIYDRYSNAILEMAIQYDNTEFKTSSKILETYLKNKHPNIKLVKSIKPISANKADNIIMEKDLDYYNGIVLPTFYNKEKIILKDLCKRAKKKGTYLELLVNHCCIKDCPQQYAHLSSDDTSQLYETAWNPLAPDLICQYANKDAVTETRIEPDEIDEYVELGIKDFKIRERGGGSYVDNDICAYGILKYLLKPEYRNKNVMDELINLINENVNTIRPLYVTNDILLYDRK